MACGGCRALRSVSTACESEEQDDLVVAAVVAVAVAVAVGVAVGVAVAVAAAVTTPKNNNTRDHQTQASKQLRIMAQFDKAAAFQEGETFPEMIYRLAP